ncbi:MAG: O-antigen ligase family protein [Steroidobacteraceae bacterium]
MTTAVVCLWFCNVPIYLGLMVFPWLTEIDCVAITVAVVGMDVLLTRGYEKQVAGGLLVWIGVLVLLNIGWFVARGGGDVSIVGVRLMFLMLMSVLYVAFAVLPRLAARVRRVLAWIAPLLVIVNIIDITNPALFVPLQSEFSHVGRAAGLFANPNQSGAALVLCALLCAPLIASRWRWLYLSWLCVGIGLTGSRGAMLAFPICATGLAVAGRLYWSDLRRTLLVVAGAVLLAMALLPILAESLGINPDVISYRYSLAAEQAGSSDASSTSERVYLAERGMQQFHYSELLGNGVGSTEEWAERTSTHNMYIMLASDFGVLGFLVLPALLIPFIGRGGGRASLVVILFVLIWSLVSHNVLSEPYVLVALALVFAEQGVRRSVSSVWSAAEPN